MTLTTHTTPAPTDAKADDGAGGSEPATVLGATSAPRNTAGGPRSSSPQTKHIELRQPNPKDGYAVHQLVSECPPLDLNSVYTYLLLSEHFSRTCVVAEVNGRIDGFVSAYLHPESSDVLFVWQVAVHERARGANLGCRMLHALLSRSHLSTVRYLETTVGPDNAASRRMFAGLADDLDAETHENALFNAALFGPDGHDDERLIRIGPITKHKGRQ